MKYNLEKLGIEDNDKLSPFSYCMNFLVERERFVDYLRQYKPDRIEPYDFLKHNEPDISAIKTKLEYHVSLLKKMCNLEDDFSLDFKVLYDLVCDRSIFENVGVLYLVDPDIHCPFMDGKITSIYLPNSNITEKIEAMYFGKYEELVLNIGGVVIPPYFVDLFLKAPGEVTKEEFVYVSNVDIRAQLIRHIGPENLYNVLDIDEDMDLIDSYKDPAYKHNPLVKKHKYKLYAAYSIFPQNTRRRWFGSDQIRMLMFKHATTGDTLVEFVRGDSIEEALDFRLGGDQKSSRLKEAF